MIYTPHNPTLDRHALAYEILFYGSANDHVVYGNSGNFVVRDYRTPTPTFPHPVRFGSARIDAAGGGWPIPLQLARQDAIGNTVTVSEGATKINITFQCGSQRGLVTDPMLNIAAEKIAANYQVHVTPGWKHGGCWVSNKSNTGFTIEWANPPSGFNSILDWTVQYLPPGLIALSTAPQAASVSLAVAKLQMYATGTYSDGSIADLTMQGVLWSVDDQTVATIDQFGLLTAHKQGVVNVSATPLVVTTSQLQLAGQPTTPVVPSVPVTLSVRITP